MHEATCPHCGVRLHLPNGDRYRCTHCRGSFRFFPVDAEAGPSRLPPFVPLAPEGSICAVHSGNAASVLCQRCGDFTCRLCAIPIERRIYCSRCFDLLCDRGAFRFTQTAFNTPRLASSLAGLSWLGLILPGLGFVLAGMAITNGVTALKQIRKKPELPGRSTAIGALVGASLNVLVSTAQVGWIVWGVLHR